MKQRWLYLLALGFAAHCAVIIAVSPFANTIRIIFVKPCTWAAAAVATGLFLRVLFDPKCRQGIDAANLELQGDRPWPSKRKIKLFDEEWGAFGSRAGSPTLAKVRAALFIEFILAMLLSDRQGSDVLFLSLAAFAVAMMLSLIHLGLNTPINQ